jgi:hypothetical protein
MTPQIVDPMGVPDRQTFGLNGGTNALKSAIKMAQM